MFIVSEIPSGGRIVAFCLHLIAYLLSNVYLISEMPFILQIEEHRE